ncbi:MAG: hypothetical protein ACRDRT_00390, partial [Pseudonocardiaceae bacterium]
MTVDSDGVSVKSSMQISGRDRLVITVEHRGEDLRYPLFVDPFVSSGGAAGDWINWGTYQTPTTPTRVASDYNINYYGWALHNPAYYPDGAYMSMPTNTYFQMGTGRGFEYRAPAGTYVYQATFGNMSHAAIWPSGNHNIWWQGILNSARNAWQHVWSGYQTAFGITHTFGAPLSDQNYANIGIGANAPNLPNGYLWSGSNKAALILDWAAVYIADPTPPQLTSPRPPNQDWSTTASRTLSVSASDHGSGLLAFKLTGPGIDKTVYSTPTPCHTTNLNWQRFCPVDQNITKNITYTPAEGTHTYTLIAIDAAENTSSTHTWTEKVDRTAPTFDPPQGSLWEQRAQPLTEKTYSTTIVARDGDASAPAAGRSGVKSIDFLVKRGDGSVAQTSLDPSPQGCMSNNCSKERAWELDTDSVEDGTYTIVAVATDQLGQQDSYTWTATVDRRPPVPTDVELESFDEARGSATIGWNTDDDPGLPNPATGFQVRYRLASGAWTAWQDAQSDLIQIMGIAADAIIDLEVRAVNAIGIVSAAVSQSVGAELSDLEQDFAEGDHSAGASAAIT